MAGTHSLLPFSFTLLPAGPPSTLLKRKREALDLISRLPAAPIEHQPAASMTPLTAAAEGKFPEWVERVAGEHEAQESLIWQVMEKKIYASDVCDQQNRFMIRRQAVEDQIMPAMTVEEMDAANFTTEAPPKKRRVAVGQDGSGNGGEMIVMRRKRQNGREHQGLEMMVYNMTGWGCLLYFTRWDAIRASVLKGKKYGEFYHRSFFNVGDMVEMWAFRDGAESKLCFVIGHKINLKLSL